MDAASVSAFTNERRFMVLPVVKRLRHEVCTDRASGLLRDSAADPD
jgi:hypothetical protein